MTVVKKVVSVFRRKGGGLLPLSLVVRCATQPDIYVCDTDIRDVMRYEYRLQNDGVVWVGVCSREIRLSRVQQNRSDKDAIAFCQSYVFFIVVDYHHHHLWIYSG